MNEEPHEEKGEEIGEEEPQEPREQAASTRPAQVVEIRTPLDRPEFDFFLDTFMKRMGLSDRKQSAIMLTNMFYDMGLDPYSELKDLQSAMEEMNKLIKNLPNTPASMAVKDTLGAQMAVKTGRALLSSVPQLRNQDPMLDRVEKMMDKYMPMIMGMRMVTQMMTAEPGERSQQKTQPSTEIPEAFKSEMDGLKEQVSTLTELMSKQRADEHEKAFGESVVASVNATILPQLQSLQAQVDAIAKQPPPPTAPDRTEEMKDISNSLKEAVDKLGEKAGAKQLTLADVDPLLGIIDKVQEKFKKEPTGDMDWKAATVSTLGETLTEAVKAYREVEVTKANALAGTAGGQPQVQPPQNAEMQTVIKRQVQNYILQRLQTGAITMNIQEAARALGLTQEQVAWAYQTLMNEGWINVKTAPAGEQKPQGVGEQNVRQPETREQVPPRKTAAPQPFVET